MSLNQLKNGVRLLLSVLLIGTGWTIHDANAAPAVPEAKAPDIKLREDPKSAVITYDQSGGRLRRVKQEPVMIIRADGTVIVGDPYGRGTGCESKLTARELQDLLKFALNEKEFFKFDADKVKQEIADEMKNKGVGIRVGDGSTITIRIQADGKDHEGKYYAPNAFAGAHPKIKSLGQFRDLHEKLQRVQLAATVGGPPVIEKDLKLANEALLKEYPKAPPLTADDLFQASKGNDPKGGKQTTIRFFKRLPPNPTQNFANVNIVRPEKGEPVVTVKAKLD